MKTEITLQYPPLDKWQLQPKGQLFHGTKVDNTPVTYILDDLLGVGGKGVVFTAFELNDPAKTIWVLKFPTFDFTYIDPDIDVEDSLKKLRGRLEAQVSEYKDDYIRSRDLLDGCDCAHETVDLIDCTYKFEDNRGVRGHDCPVPQKIGVQRLLHNSEWCALDNWILRDLNGDNLDLSTWRE